MRQIRHGAVGPAAGAPRLRLGDRTWLGICALGTALKLWLVSAQTLYVYAPTPADDELFVSTAVSLLRGEWLGPFSNFTFVKGPGYSLWLALNQLTGVRLLLSQAILYVIACVVLARALRPAVPSRARRSLLYLAVLFNPVTWADGPATRVTREGIYSSLTILVLGLAIGAALRLRDGPRPATPWAAAAGFTGALLALTREEGIWLAPSLAIVAVTGWFASRRAGWRAWAIPGAAAALAYSLPLTAIAAVNLSQYGVFQLGETRASYYTSAYAALTRVETTRWNPYVPVPREARARIFEVSPAFREVAPYLEEGAESWTVHGCRLLDVCDDVAGGWFMWGFREAVARAGKYRDARVARAWYEQLSREIDGACDDGRLACRPRLATLVPRAEYLRPLGAALLRAASFLATFDEVTPYSSLPSANEMDLAWFERVTNERVARPFIQMHGVVESRLGEITGAVVDPRESSANGFIQRTSLPSPGRAAAAGASLTRLSIRTTCVAGCLLVLRAGDGSTLPVPIEADTQVLGGGKLTWTTEEFLSGAVPTPDRPAGTRRLAVLAAATRAYAVGTPVLLALALALLVRGLVRAARRRAQLDLPLIALALLAAVAARLLILAFLDVSSFPAVSVMYCSPAYGLVIAVIALMLVSPGTAAPDDRPAPASRGAP